MKKKYEYPKNIRDIWEQEIGKVFDMQFVSATD